MLKNLRCVIIQDCAVFTKKISAIMLSFDVFPHILKSDLFQNYSNKMMNDRVSWKKTLSQSIDNILPGVKECIKIQIDAIYKNGQSI